MVSLTNNDTAPAFTEENFLYMEGEQISSFILKIFFDFIS